MRAIGQPRALAAPGAAPGAALGAARTPEKPPRTLTPREKAAVIVRLLLAEGVRLPIDTLPDHLQAALTEQIGQMRLVDRATLRAVVDEFLAAIEGAGIAFPGGIDGALGLLDGHISPTAARRLRRMAGASARADPWDRVVAMDAGRLLPLLGAESVEVGAVMLSKLPVARAADLLGQLPGDKARRIAFAMSLTADVDPDTVRRIGDSLAAQLESQPPRAFDRDPVERVGAILNQTPSALRDKVLSGLDEDDRAFAERVRKAIFTFAHIPARVAPRDVPKVLRGVEPAVLVAALAAAATRAPEVGEFLLANLSTRMADTLREDVAAHGKLRDRDAEAAMAAVVAAVRAAEAAGEVVLRLDEEDDDDVG